MRTRRRLLASLAGVLAIAPTLSHADQTHRLGVIRPGPMTPDSPPGGLLIGALADMGCERGQNLAFASRGSGDIAKLPGLEAEGSETLVAEGYPYVEAAGAAGFPAVVLDRVGDPVDMGLAESWAHPDGLITGISDVAALGVREPDDFNAAFVAMEHDKPDAILLVADALTLLYSERVFDFAKARRAPAIYESDVFTRDGGLTSYGADQNDSVTRVASIGDRILKGAKPADVPFEQPTRNLFVFNTETARAMGREPPVTALGLTDDVIV
jgi:putative ABC transport system substrate-binding protein